MKNVGTGPLGRTLGGVVAALLLIVAPSSAGALGLQVGPDDSHIVDEDSGQVVVNVLANDGDGAVLTGEFTQGTKGGVQAVVNGDLTTGFTYEPNADADGVDSFTYDFTLGEVTSTATVNVTINPVSDAPVAVEDALPLEDGAAIVEDEAAVDITANLLGNDTDADEGTVLTIVGINADGAAGTVLLDAGVVTYQATSQDAITDSFSYTISDGDDTTENATATANITITPVDDAPVAVDDPDVDVELSADEGATITINVQANDIDVDGGDNTVSIVSDPANGTATVTDEGSVAYVHAGGEDTSDSFTYSLNGQEETATVSITITPTDDAPVAVDDPIDGETITLDEDGSILIDVLANDTDVDAGPMEISAIGDVSVGTAVVEDGQIRYTHTGNTLGDVEFTYSLNNQEDTATVTLTVVNADDDAPVVEAPGTLEVQEDDEDGETVAILTVGQTDDDGSALSIASVVQPSKGSATVDGGSVTYTPAADANGDDSFTVMVTDGDGGDDDVAVLVSVVVAPVNDAPVALDDRYDYESYAYYCDYYLEYGYQGYATYCEPALLEDTPKLLNLLANDSDIDSGGLVVSAESLELDPEIGTLAVADGGVLLTPAQDYFGTFSFTYRITDGDLVSEPASVAVLVVNIDDPLVATPDAVEMAEDNVVRIEVLENDIDVDKTGFGLVEVTQPTDGFVSIVGDQIRVQPDPDFEGLLSFTYTIRATSPINYFDSGLTSCQQYEDWGYNPLPSGCELITGTVTVTVNGANDRPEAVRDTVETDEDQAITIDVLANDTDSDTEELSIDRTTAPSLGTVEIVDNKVVYTPNADVSGDDTFIYYASDGDLLSVAVVYVTINPVNDAPTIVGQDDLETDEDVPLTFTVEVDDIDSENLTLGFTTEPILNLVIDGFDVIYTPEDNFFGPVSFDLRVTDDAGEQQRSADATFTVDVASINDTPVAEDVPLVELDEEGVYEGSVTVSDVEDQLLISEVTTAPAKGSVEVAGRDFVYTGDEDATGDDSFVVTFSDSDGGSVDVPVLVSINPVNDAPTIVGQTDLVTDEDFPLTFTVEVDDVDSENLTLDLYDPCSEELDICLDVPPPTLQRLIQGGLEVSPYNGEFNIDGTTVTFTPNPDWHGEVYFELVVSDGTKGSTAVGVFLITVNSVNDLPVITAEAIELDEDDSGSTPVTIADVEDDYAELELTATVTTNPTKGSVEIVEGEAVYTANADVNGDDSFVLTVTDSNDGSAETTVAVVINPMNDAPVAGECAGATVVSGESVDLDITGCASDVDGDDLTMVSGSAASEDGAVAKINGILIFTPQDGVLGDVTVELLISDGSASVGVEIAVTVTAPAPSPYIGVAEKDGQLVRIYAAMLGRLPDEGGFDYWSALLEDGLTIDSMVEEFGRSPEFKGTYGDKMANDSDADWVTFVYRQVLNREPDAVGRAYWENLLGSGDLSRADMVVWFAESQEFKDSTQTL